MAVSMKPPRRKRSSPPSEACELPSHWTPQQALAVFECIELMRDQLWLAYGPEIQRAWRGQLATERPQSDLDPDAPF